MYDSMIAIGDRVALAPHTDLWMRGARFGEVLGSTVRAGDGRFTHVFRVLVNERTYSLDSADVLGAVR